MSPSDRPSRASGSQPPGAERRYHPRVPIELKVEYKRLNSFFADYTRNISKGGTFIATSKPLPMGTDFVFKLSIPTLPEPLELHGKVAWIVTAEGATPEQPAGMGIRFEYQSEAEQGHVHHTVERLILDSLGPFLGRRLLDLGETDTSHDGD
jgi:type IV pilus assembly protein PilZ